MTTTNRPPSCDKLEKLKECPACAGTNVEMINGGTWVVCRGQDCGVEGPINDPDANKWNSIPRRSEVGELLRLVDASIIGTPTPAEGRLLQYADRIRKEWKI